MNEATLTGESEPAAKSTALEPSPLPEGTVRPDAPRKGTTAVAGRAVAGVVTTGSSTELGRIAELLGRPDDSPTPSPAPARLLGRWLALVAIAVCTSCSSSGSRPASPAGCSSRR